MSHLMTAQLRVTSIKDLTKAVAVFGGVLEEARTFNSYIEEHCDYRIKIPGCTYQIGVRQQKDGTYTLHYDTYSDGRKLVEKFGQDLGKLKQEYGVQRVMSAAKLQRGWRFVRKKLPNGKIQLRMQHA